MAPLTHEPQQTLDGIAPPAQTSADRANVLPMMALIGQLSGDPQLHDTIDGKVVIDVVLQQHLAHHPRALPIHARFEIADEGSYALNREAAHAKAYRLRQRREVVLRARGIEQRQYQGREVLHVVHCDALEAAQ
jgi:hypothetical protein